VIESDELETGMRREATYYGFIVFLQKAGAAFLLAIMQWVLQWSGYVIPLDPANPLAVVQPASVLTAIRFMIGPVPAILLVISIILMARYPISRESHAELVEELRLKHLATPPIEPVP
jgi:GPH family glycoside/pentoside/hexuronide:cation symporter